MQCCQASYERVQGTYEFQHAVVMYRTNCPVWCEYHRASGHCVVPTRAQCVKDHDVMWHEYCQVAIGTSFN